MLLDPGRIWVTGGELTAGAYRAVFRSTDDGGQGFLVFLRNSAIVSVITTVVTLLAAIPGAYAVSRLRFGGRRLVSGLFLVVYLFPPMILAIPLFVLFTRLGLRGSLLGLALVYVAQTVPVAIFMLLNYFETIPESLEEAGLMDGLTHLGVLRRISLPLAAPSVVATGLYVFMIAWNEFLFALLFLLERPDRWTVSLGLSRLSGSDRGAEHGPDGRLGGAHRADRRAVLPRRAPAGRGSHRRRREGLGRRCPLDTVF